VPGAVNGFSFDEVAGFVVGVILPCKGDSSPGSLGLSAERGRETCQENCVRSHSSLFLEVSQSEYLLDLVRMSSNPSYYL